MAKSAKKKHTAASEYPDILAKAIAALEDATAALAAAAANLAQVASSLGGPEERERAFGGDDCTAAGRNKYKTSQKNTAGKVEYKHVKNRALKMLKCKHDIDARPDTDPLPISGAIVAKLERTIEDLWFDDVRCYVDPDVLKKVTTYFGLYNLIHGSCTDKA